MPLPVARSAWRGRETRAERSLPVARSAWRGRETRAERSLPVARSAWRGRETRAERRFTPENTRSPARKRLPGGSAHPFNRTHFEIM